EGERFCQVRVQFKLGRDGPRNLCDFNGMGEPVPEVIGVASRKNLRLRLEPSKSAGMDHSIAVALKVVAVRMRRLWMPPSKRLFHPDSVVGEHENSLA